MGGWHIPIPHLKAEGPWEVHSQVGSLLPATPKMTLSHGRRWEKGCKKALYLSHPSSLLWPACGLGALLV